MSGRKWLHGLITGGVHGEIAIASAFAPHGATRKALRCGRLGVAYPAELPTRFMFPIPHIAHRPASWIRMFRS